MKIISYKLNYSNYKCKIMTEINFKKKTILGKKNVFLWKNKYKV